MTVRSVWWRALAFSHRWLGIAGCFLFILWFLSGIAMMYVRMPAVTPAERYERLSAVDASLVRVSVADAARFAGLTATVPVQLVMLAERPVYRFGGPAPTTVFADRLETLGEVSQVRALSLAAAFAPRHARTLQYKGTLTIPDQWTLQSRGHLPLHRIALGDDAATELYVSSRTGEVVMDTNHRERLLAYVGPVAHWLYLPVLRRNGPLWTDVIIWSSIAGCVLCVSGLMAGLLRFAPFRRYAVRGERPMSPYAGWMKWHHYAGLTFGLITLTWTFSGLLSMGPFPLLSSGGATAEQRRAITGTPPPLENCPLQDTQAAIVIAARALVPKELSLITFRSAAYWIASETPVRRVLISAANPEHAVPSFDRGTMEMIARDLMPGGSLISLAWIDEYDDYYYDRTRARRLPVLRARYADPAETWIYLDPSRGGIALVSRRPDRLNRWLYNGLHSLDFAWLMRRRPLWDIVVIVLSVGGMAGAATSLLPAWRRLRRHTQSLALLLRGGSSRRRSVLAARATPSAAPLGSVDATAIRGSEPGGASNSK
jgi:hypothetical protein